MDELTAQRKQLRAALAEAGLTMGQYASMLGVSRVHLYYVLTGARKSPRITQAVAAYIAAYKSTESAA